MPVEIGDLVDHPPPSLVSLTSRPARRRAPRRLRPLAPVPDPFTAAALDDDRELQALIDDLLALLDAGLITTIDDDSQVRYAPTEITITEEAA